MQLVEVVGGVTLLAGPLEAQPLYVALDRVDVFLVFLGRVGVVEAQVALAAKLLGQAEVQADRLGMADMQVAVGLRRETGDDFRVLASVQIGLDDGTKKVRSGDNLWLAHGVLDHAGARHRVGRLIQSAYHSRSCQPPDRPASPFSIHRAPLTRCQY